MAHEKQHAVEALEHLHTDRFDYSCDEEEELELQAENIIPYHNNGEGSFSNTEVGNDVNQQAFSSSCLDLALVLQVIWQQNNILTCPKLIIYWYAHFCIPE